jgi:hypothetical protein
VRWNCNSIRYRCQSMKRIRVRVICSSSYYSWNTWLSCTILKFSLWARPIYWERPFHSRGQTSSTWKLSRTLCLCCSCRLPICLQLQSPSSRKKWSIIYSRKIFLFGYSRWRMLHILSERLLNQFRMQCSNLTKMEMRLAYGLKLLS